MGIPFFFREVVRKHPDIIGQNVTICDRLFLDFNSVIHGSAQLVLSQQSQPPQTIEQSICKECVFKIFEITKTCMPKSLLYIAVDGVAPLAKQIQQRRRRYMSSLKNCHAVWDTNNITAGTDFMYTLDDYLKKYFEKKKLPYEVIIDSHTTPGEGEAKALKYIKNINTEASYTDVIYGQDADLIMLCLTCKCSNMFIMREMKNFVNYVNIDKLKIGIAHHLGGEANSAFMNDYVFICFFLGNDFLPNISFLKLNHNALDFICKLYQRVYQTEGHAIACSKEEEYQINYAFLKRYITELSGMENALMQDVSDVYYESGMPNKFSKGLIDPKTDPNWRLSYYHYLFGFIDTPNIRKVSETYLEGLRWITDYYFNQNYDMSWCYHNLYAPTVNDLANAIVMIDKSTNTKPAPKTDLVLQLLTVLPPSSKELIPEKQRSLMTDLRLGAVHYYPSEFQIINYLKEKTWENMPILPQISFSHLEKCYEKTTRTEL